MRKDKQLFAMQIDKELIAQLKREAEANGLTVSAYVRFILLRRHK